MLTLSRFLRLQRLALSGSLFVLLFVFAVTGSALAADQRLTDAEDALVKAAALVDAAEPGVDDPKSVNRFERSRTRALRNIERALGAIEDAKQAVDE